MASITLSGVGKVYRDGTRAISDLNLAIDEGQLMVLVGPSGCGKTTALRMVAGLEEVTEGEVRIDERVVNELDPRQRDVAMVFQNYALYPHMSVFENLAFPLRARGMSRAEIRDRVERTARLLALEEQLKRKPRTLSGGQRQRVAMGRAIIREPRAFLMDEPLSNLDATLRAQLRSEIANIQRELGVTTIYVTHDQVEAMTMGTRIAVLRGGVLQQEGPPQQIYDAPGNLFVATFIGSPPMNLLQGRIESDADALVCSLGEQRLSLVPKAAVRAALEPYIGVHVAVGIRPEHLSAPAYAHRGRRILRGRVKLVESLGPERLVQIELNAEPVVAHRGLEPTMHGHVTAAAGSPRDGTPSKALVTGRFDAHVAFRPGDIADVAVAMDRLHFFDLSTGRSIA